jgi:glycerol-3-phosphate dehydrogenase
MRMPHQATAAPPANGTTAERLIVAAEALFAARREQAHSVADVLLRRTRLGLLDAQRLCGDGAEGAQAVARALGSELGWDDARVRKEVGEWRTVARAEGLVPAAMETVG